MPNIERIREALQSAPSEEYFTKRAFAGWRPVAMIWEREIGGAGPESPWSEEPPFGLPISADNLRLEENPGEKQALLKIVDGIVEDKRISQIARELNAEWLRTRQGRAWTAKDVFELLPRLVEAGPRVFPTKEWAARRQLLQVS
jgi:hypothetical protein